MRERPTDTTGAASGEEMQLRPPAIFKKGPGRWARGAGHWARGAGPAALGPGSDVITYSAAISACEKGRKPAQALYQQEAALNQA